MLGDIFGPKKITYYTIHKSPFQEESEAAKAAKNTSISEDLKVSYLNKEVVIPKGKSILETSYEVYKWIVSLENEKIFNNTKEQQIRDLEEKLYQLKNSNSTVQQNGDSKI